MGKNTTSKGQDAFFNYYEGLYGIRWNELFRSLSNEKHYGALKSHITKDTYYLDLASLITAWALDVLPGQHVLDLCAAPGGKALVILRNLFPDYFPEKDLIDLEQVVVQNTDENFIIQPIFTRAIQEKCNLARNSSLGRLVLNERSSSRRLRLKGNISNHSNTGMNIEFTSFDAGKFGMYQQQIFDRVLADVPCSSEQHLVLQPKYLNDWSPNRTKSLAIQAGAIALSGFDCLKPKGKMVYSTCSLSPLENEAVVHKLLKKRPNAKILDLTWVPLGFEPKFPGYLILPDSYQGLGPMYFCIIEKEGL